MTTTTNYGYTVVVGSDTPVNIQNDIAPNFTAIDTDLKAVSDDAITTATHTVAGSVHQLVRTDADRNVMYFVATGDMVAGDTFTVDGVTVTARLVNGESLATGSFKINNNVFGILVGTVLNLFVPGATATASTFLSWQTIKIMCMGVVAFGVGTAAGVLLAKLMNLFLKEKINPLIGSAGVSAVPMAARVSQVEGQKAKPGNFLLMHAMGPNVAGVIGSAIAAGVFLSLFK